MENSETWSRRADEEIQNCKAICVEVRIELAIDMLRRNGSEETPDERR